MSAFSDCSSTDLNFFSRLKKLFRFQIGWIGFQHFERYFRRLRIRGIQIQISAITCPMKTLKPSRGLGIQVKTVKQLPFLGIIFVVMLFMLYRSTYYQFSQTVELEHGMFSASLNGLPFGIIQTNSDLEMKPLWSSGRSRAKIETSNPQNLLTISVGLKQKKSVDNVVQKFLAENFTVMLFHYDDNVNEWSDLNWSKNAIHVSAYNQTKWWFAKRFLHPSVVSIYEYIFLWDEDLGVENFHPGRYLHIVRSEGFEISQPALDPISAGIHHKITVRRRKEKFHRRVWDGRGSSNCSEASEEPPCKGIFVEGMAPVFSRSAWKCVWNLIQNDLVHGWGVDLKLGFCAQGDRTKNVGIVDSEYVLHMGIQSLGDLNNTKKHLNARTKIRRQSTSELRIFEERWKRAVKNDRRWDPW